MLADAETKAELERAEGLMAKIAALKKEAAEKISSETSQVSDPS
jgi:hypothetical protein